MKFVGDKKMTIVIKDVYKKEVLEKVIYIIMREVFLKRIRKKIIRQILMIVVDGARLIIGKEVEIRINAIFISKNFQVGIIENRFYYY